MLPFAEEELMLVFPASTIAPVLDPIKTAPPEVIEEFRKIVEGAVAVIPPEKVNVLLGEVPKVKTPELLKVAALLTAAEVPAKDKL
jgi:hypothetical protein